MFAQVAREARRRLVVARHALEVRRLLHARNPLLDLAHAGQVLLQLALVGLAELLFEILRVLGHEVQQAALVARFLVRLHVTGLALPNSRSNTSRGFVSFATGDDSVRHAMVEEYAHE